VARHSAPRRTAPARTPARAHDAIRAARHRSAVPAPSGRLATSAVVAAATLTGGALVIGDHTSVAQADIAAAAFQAPDPDVIDDGATALMTAAVEPVSPLPVLSDDLDVSDAPVDAAEFDTAVFDAAALVKAVTLVETQRAEAEAAAAEEAARLAREAEEERARGCAAGDDGFETVQSWVREVGVDLRCRFGVETVHGVAGRAGASDHPAGLALDLMVDRDPGEQLAEYAAANMDELGISYVIYRQRINTGSGWEAMEDRGGATANHMDHVHISFDDR
jgi:hypothetical protein